MIQVCYDALKTLQQLRAEMIATEIEWADSLRLIERCEVFETLVNAMKETPQLLEDSDDVEIASIEEMEKILGEACHYVKEFVQRSSYFGMTEPSFRQGCATDFAKLNTRIIKLAQTLSLLDDIDYDERRTEDLEVNLFFFFFVVAFF